VGVHHNAAEKMKQVLKKWGDESRNDRNDGYTQEGYRGYLEEIRDEAARQLDQKKITRDFSGKDKARAKDPGGNWWDIGGRIVKPE